MLVEINLKSFKYRLVSVWIRSVSVEGAIDLLIRLRSGVM